jgi:hypothetical protein
MLRAFSSLDVLREFGSQLRHLAVGCPLQHLQFACETRDVIADR